MSEPDEIQLSLDTTSNSVDYRERAKEVNPRAISVGLVAGLAV
ncbi:MAG TPA: hypothetical protein V6C90_15935 [Coleofasciculaceae cyanobacterium]